jgi:FkbM family methyltransferase
MINITYTNEIKITTEQLDKIYSENQLPLRLEIRNKVSNDLVWSTELSSHWWATFPNSEMNNTSILDAQSNIVYSYTWDVMINGSFFYKSLWLYCKKLKSEGKEPNGLAIGTHDGEFGEWCPLVYDNLSKITLVEASSKQFEKLNQNYNRNSNVKLVNSLVTKDGKPVTFFEGGKGYTNSIVERVIRSWEIEQISSTTKESISINELVSNISGKLDWLHLDVEGLDSELIMNLDESLLPNFIIFEDNNLLDEEKNNLMKYLADRGYLSKSENGICMSIK